MAPAHAHMTGAENCLLVRLSANNIDHATCMQLRQDHFGRGFHAIPLIGSKGDTISTQNTVTILTLDSAR